MSTDNAEPTGRGLPVWGFLVLVVGYLVVVQLAPLPFREAGAEYARFESTEDLLRSLLPPVVAGSVISVGAVLVLRWRVPVLVEEIRTPRWTWIFPGLLMVGIVSGFAYADVLDEGTAFVLLLLGLGLLIGVSEETMFRGIGVVAFRRAGHTEGKVALWTCVIFGLAHGTNLFVEGVSALPQVLATAAAGYFFYITRRVSGLLVLPIVVHGLWDISLFSNGVTGEMSGRALVFILVDVVLLVIALATLRKVFPRRTEAATASS